MILVCHNVFGLFVQHPSWSVEGGGQGIKTPCTLYTVEMYQTVRLMSYDTCHVHAWGRFKGDITPVGVDEV